MSEGLLEAGHTVDVFQPSVRHGRNQNTHRGIGKWRGYMDKYVYGPLELKRQLREARPELVHICDHANAVYLPYLNDVATVVTCHDMFAIKTWLGQIPGQQKSKIGGLQQRWIFKHLQNAKAIACVSQATLDDLTQLAAQTREHAQVIPSALPFRYAPLPRADAEHFLKSANLKTLAGNPLPDQFLLHVGNNSWYKNRDGVIEISIKILAKTPMLGLVLAGAALSDQQRLALEGYENRVALAVRPANETLQALYSKATLFLFPSLAEGLGWPPLEAQACGCAVAVSDIEPLRSNCSSALLIDPNDSDTAAQQIIELLNDPQRLSVLRADGLINAQRFQADAMIQAYIDFYRHAIAEHTA
ncbi:glycosyltransferase family 4 protein [Cerasicoccus frondis]|uniref:glycosyltransferase family 4 protein n=1 Tax=Cerasicoccus frondis TaxID=490090 RepID=UPI0028526AF5|nr:glycosyltransferase family 1 protein [Cerasicoccus frondis]